MKKLIFLFSIIFILLITFNLKGQNYYPILGDTNTWYYLSCFEGCYTDIYCSKGDTIFGSQKYRIIGFCDMQNLDFFLREDTAEKKVYKRYNSNVELLMYDFSLQAGDSILLQNYSAYNDSINNVGWYYLDSIKLVNISIGIRKSFYFNSSDGFHLEWIEGVGTLGSPINSFNSQIDLWDGISCFYRNDTLIYQSQLSQQKGTCDFTLNIKNLEYDSLLLFPNPTSNEITLYNIQKFRSLLLTDLCGKILIIKDINSKNLHIDLSVLQSGIYLLKLVAKNQIVTKKIIKYVK